MADRFNGFSPLAPVFFEQLAANNNKTWFEAHRDEYQVLLLEPLKLLVSELADTMQALDPALITLPAVDKTISRLYRDTRFSRNKSPYKTCLWITFKRYSPDWKTAPCFFFEITADSYRYGMGFYSASRQTMDNLRRLIEAQPERFRQTVAWLAQQDTFVLEGDRYKRPLNPTLPDDLQTWHCRKNVCLICNREVDGRLFTQDIRDDLATGFRQLQPLYDLFWQMV